MRVWKRLTGRLGSPTTLEDRFAGFVEDTPHRYRVWLVDSADQERAVAAIRDGIGIDASAVPVDGADGRIGIDVTMGGGWRFGAITWGLRDLRKAGIKFNGYEALDVLGDLSKSELERAIDTSLAPGRRNKRLLEALGGDATMAAIIEQYRAAASRGSRTRQRARAYADAAFFASVNTPGTETLLVEQALAAPDDASTFLGAAANRVELSKLMGIPWSVADDLIVRVAGSPRGSTHLGMALIPLIQRIGPPYSEAVVGYLGDIVAHGDAYIAQEALAALRSAGPSPKLLQTIEVALRAKSQDVRSTALEILAMHYGAAARPVWQEHLDSKSPALRYVAAIVLGEHGTEEDLDLAVSTLAKLLRARPFSVDMGPRGSEIVELLLRHRDHPVARVGLDDVTARWGRIPRELQEWLEANHAWLDPVQRRRAGHQFLADTEPSIDEVEVWPMPTIERVEGGLRLEFDGQAAYSKARDRFEALVEIHPAIEILDSDREWIEVASTAKGTRAVLRQLWAEAGKPDREES